jgi:lipopolysaccharide transport system ATP-binding protein
MSEVLVNVENVSKKFCRSLKRGMLYTTTDVGRDLLKLPGQNETLRPGEFWAVQDVSFELRRGECLGLIGVNGAGKSTLLKMLNGIIRPDKGHIRMQGRVGALIEVGAGFHPMLTGRENIYVNGAILGMGKRELDRKFDQIVAFSGLEPDILDAPVKSYSSGMYVRLGFAIAVHTEPDILLVDEVLAVGDIRFTGQCREKIAELRSQGTSIIFVSHNLSQVEQMCDQGLLMIQGKVKVHGNVGLATRTYRDYVTQRIPRSASSEQAAPPSTLPLLRLIAGDVLGDNGQPAATLRCGDTATLRLMLATDTEVTSGVLAISLYREEDQQATGIGYLEVGKELPVLRSGELSLRFHCQVIPGTYRVLVTFSTDGQFGLVDEFSPCGFAVVPGTKRRCPPVGVYMLDVWWDDRADRARDTGSNSDTRENESPILQQIGLAV